MWKLIIIIFFKKFILKSSSMKFVLLWVIHFEIHLSPMQQKNFVFSGVWQSRGRGGDMKENGNLRHVWSLRQWLLHHQHRGNNIWEKITILSFSAAMTRQFSLTSTDTRKTNLEQYFLSMKLFYFLCKFWLIKSTLFVLVICNFFIVIFYTLLFCKSDGFLDPEVLSKLYI